MTRRLLVLCFVLVAAPAVSLGQTFTPHSPAGLSVTFTTERAGGTRVLVFGELRNSNASPAQHVVPVDERLHERAPRRSPAHGGGDDGELQVGERLKQRELPLAQGRPVGEVHVQEPDR